MQKDLFISSTTTLISGIKSPRTPHVPGLPSSYSYLPPTHWPDLKDGSFALFPVFHWTVGVCSLKTLANSPTRGGTSCLCPWMLTGCWPKSCLQQIYIWQHIGRDAATSLTWILLAAGNLTICPIYRAQVHDGPKQTNAPMLGWISSPAHQPKLPNSLDANLTCNAPY